MKRHTVTYSMTTLHVLSKQINLDAQRYNYTIIQIEIVHVISSRYPIQAIVIFEEEKDV